MGTYTPNLNLYKPGGGSGFNGEDNGADELVDIDQINSNFDILDGVVHTMQSDVQGAVDTSNQNALSLDAIEAKNIPTFGTLGQVLAQASALSQGRSALYIGYGTALPGSPVEGQIFFLYS